MNYKKKFIKSITVAVFIFTVLIVWRGYARADWVDPRDGVRPTQPSSNRDGRILLPTQSPTIQPTQPTQPPQPTATPIVGGPSVTPVPTSSSSSTDDPCASGKSYSGPYCGWSPSTSSSTDGGSLGSSPRIGGGQQILGLSYTAGDGISWSDIIFLTGVLCLLLYARSKLSKEIRV